MAKKKKRKRNPVRKCSNCKSKKHDRRTCKSKKRKSCKKSKRRSKSKRRKNPGACEACGCTCKNVDVSRYLRRRNSDPVWGDPLYRRRNPGWSFKGGRAVPHEQKLEDLYQKSTSFHSRPRRSRFRSHYRRNASPWGSSAWATHMDAPPVANEGPATSLDTSMTEHFLGPMRHRRRRNPYFF